MPEIPDPILSIVHERDVRFVRFIWTDNAGLIRAKAVRSDFLAEYQAAGGVGIAAAQQALPAMYDAPAPGAGIPTGEVHLRADWDTFAPLPYAPGQARVLTDAYAGEQPWAHCPRSFLRRMLDRLAERGLRLRAAFENEFYLLRPEPGGPVAADSTVFSQTQALDRLAPLLDAIAAALEAQGLQVEQLYAESGGGQFEIPIRYADGLGPADNQVVFRETVYAIAHQHGLIASFLPKIFPDRAGSGAHLHLSLWQGDRNLVPDPAGPRTISTEAKAFVAGLLRHLPALMTITTPSPNSFKRIRPRSWSGAYTCWGYGNREAAVRVPVPPSDGPVSNVELKTVDPTCNPYLALGAVLAAGLDGLEQRLDPGESLPRNPADLSDDERRARGIAPLPTALGEAIAALEQDRVLLDALGPELARSFLAVRAAEWEALREMPHDEEVNLLLERY